MKWGINNIIFILIIIKMEVVKMDNMFNLTGSIGGHQIYIVPEKRMQRKTNIKT